ncbi:MAG: putative addiction module antidote protein [Elusimicrobia bacterium]|nr:putative addiction module antidote protein [Candidatus Obscuribacterium magneticum]
MKRTHDYHKSLIKALKNPNEAAEYLNAALEEGDKEMFLIALRNVAEAFGGMAKLSRLTNLKRANLYKMLSDKGHPEIQSIHKVMEALGLKLTVSVQDEEKPLKAA